MKLDISKIVIKDLAGTEVKDFHKTFANACYTFIDDLGLLDKVKAMYEGQEIDVTDTELANFRKIVDLKNDQWGLTAFARKALHDFMDDAAAKAKKTA